MNNQISIKEIAEMSGVSVATVSRVINQNGRFSKATEEKVLKVIREYNYQPNQIAKGLRTSRTDAIGVIVPDITNEFFSAMILALQERLFRDNYSCVIFNTNESEEIEKQCISSLMALNISGIISANGRLELNDIIRADMPVLYVDRMPDKVLSRRNSVVISSDHEEGAYLAGKELAARGCRRVMCVTALKNADVTCLRNAGFTRACQEFGMELSQDMVFNPAEVSADSGYRIVDEALRNGLQFDGIFCQTDWLAIGALNALTAHRIAVPEQVKLVGFDDIRVASMVHRPLTTIHQPSQELGTIAGELMLQMCSHEAPGERVIKLPVSLVRRSTT